MTRMLSAFIVAILLLGCTSTPKVWEETPPLRVNYLAYPVDWNGRTIMIGARLQVPVGMPGKLPAVILMHGTSGFSYRGVYYAAAGYLAALPAGPKRNDNLPDIAGAYRLLVTRPEIDASRIGLMGSSMGGIETRLMMPHRHSDALLGPDAHMQAAVAFYPVCWLFNHVPGADLANFVDAPIRIFVGSG